MNPPFQRVYVGGHPFGLYVGWAPQALCLDNHAQGMGGICVPGEWSWIHDRESGRPS